MKQFESEHFDLELIDIGNENYLHLIHIEEIDFKLKSLIDHNISEICFGDPTRDVAYVKKRLQRFLKNEKSHLKGAIAEFMAHVYLRDIGFNQEFLFLNMEENSLKKGFDGFYSLSETEWLFESKSGDYDSEGASHPEKISAAYRDLKSKIEGNSENNPWENALNHANNIHINSDDNLRQKLKKLAEEYEFNSFSDIGNFNIIPGSTIFLNKYWEKMNSHIIEKRIKNYFSNKSFNGLNVICVNKKSVNLFLNYINNK